VWLKIAGFSLLGLFSCSGCGRSIPEVVGPCNGSEDLCDRRFDQVAFATTHNSMSNEDDGWVTPNQKHGIVRQLQDGVRAFMLDLHKWEGQVMLCHFMCVAGSTLLGMKPLETALLEIKQFMDENPDEVLVIIFESYVAAHDVEEVFEAVGFSGRIYAHRRGQPWPTLRRLISSGKRLVVFSDNAAGAADWHHPVWDYCWETNFEVQSLAQFSCDLNRGSQDNDLFILNNFISDPYASEESAAQANAFDFLYPRATGCFEETGRMPTFIAVDFYSIGDVMTVVEELNK
jgi:hypothetical protein